MDARLPDEIKPFFIPFPTQVEQLFAAAKFQYCGMVEKVQYQASVVNQLVEKVNKQKELLGRAKEKISQISEMESRIKELERENKMLRSNQTSARSKYYQPKQLPRTVDLTGDVSFEEVHESPPKKRLMNKSFINQVKQSSHQKKVEAFSHFKYSPRNENDSHGSTMDLTKGKIAESTNILRCSPLPHHHVAPRGAKLGTGRSHPPLSPLTLSSHRIGNTALSHGSGASNSLTSRSDEFILAIKGQQLPHSQLRAGKSRAATSQLAQRLSSHMKVGGLARAPASVGMRPVSSFHNPILLLRRK